MSVSDHLAQIVVSVGWSDFAVSACVRTLNNLQKPLNILTWLCMSLPDIALLIVTPFASPCETKNCSTHTTE